MRLVLIGNKKKNNAKCIKHRITYEYYYYQIFSENVHYLKSNLHSQDQQNHELPINLSMTRHLSQIALFLVASSKFVLTCNWNEMDIRQEVLQILDDVLSLKGRSASFSNDTPLLGAVPELDSIAVVALLTVLEENLGLAVADDEIDGSIFATVGNLVSFVQSKLAH